MPPAALIRSRNSVIQFGTAINFAPRVAVRTAVDGRGRLRGVYASTLPLEMQRLREDVEVLLRP